MKLDAAGPQTQTHAQAQAAANAAKQLESFFLRRMLAEARPEGGGGLDAGFAGDTFKSMLDEAIADKMSAAGGVGMAKMFAKQLGGDANEIAKIGAPHPPIAGQLPDHTLGPASDLPELRDAPRLQLPISGARATSGYGMRHDPIQNKDINHPGFDLAAKTGTPVGAAAGGKVTHAGPAGTYGNLVIVEHASGYETRYAHLSAVSVKVGDTVAPGDHVGDVGTTGYSTGPHLHFELRHSGKPLDPAPLLPLNKPTTRSVP